MLLLSSLLLAILPPAMGFSFFVDTDALTQCGSMDISWTGGTPPYTLTIIPSFDYPTNITLPDSAMSNGQGFYRWQVNYPTDVQLVAMMGDATGVGSGGVSNVYRVGSGSNSCPMRSTQLDFMFQLNETSVSQCDPVEISWDTSATPPVRILGVIPQGQVFEFSSVGEANSLMWNTNIASGTQFILAAFNNGPSGNGGSSTLYTVGQSLDSSCLDDSSPSSTPAASSPTGTSGTPTRTGGGGGIKTVTAITTVQPSSDTGGLGVGAVAGIVVGALVLNAALVAGILWCCCRRQIANFLSHRRQMKSQRVKPGDVDLASQISGNDGIIIPDPNEAIFTGGAGGSRRDSRGSHLRTTRTRTTTDGGVGYAESSISPFWDDNRVSSSQYTLDVDLGPPLSAQHSRGNSFGSAPDSPATHAPTSPLVPPGATSGYQPPNSASSRYGGGGTSSSMGNLTKAQLASSFAPTNPDLPSANSDSAMFSQSPPLSTPAGGFVRERDAGRVGDDDSESPAAEHLPPMYDPQWQTQSPRGRGQP